MNEESVDTIEIDTPTETSIVPKTGRTYLTVSISWKNLIIAEMQILSPHGEDVHLQQLYAQLENKKYINDRGMQTSPQWANGNVPLYRSSVQSTVQKLVRQKRLIRVERGVYKLVEATPPNWTELEEINRSLRAPHAVMHQITVIERCHKLRDGLVAYYKAKCQICRKNSPYIIPTDLYRTPYAEVHHVRGLAETFHSMSEQELNEFNVNGLGNLVVLCAHHHKLIHEHFPPYRLVCVNNTFSWKANGGATLKLNCTEEHKQILLKTFQEG